MVRSNTEERAEDVDLLDDEGDIQGNEETGKTDSPDGLSMLLPSIIGLSNPPPNEVPSEPNKASTANGMLNSTRSVA